MSPVGRTTTRVAIVHDWLTGMRGGEKVLAALCRLIPQATILTLIHCPGQCGPGIESRRIRTSFLNDLPAVGRYYRWLLPAMPLAMGQLDASEFDLVISSSHCVANGFAGRRAGQLHVCYCHTPMRYIWSGADEYRRRLGPAGLALAACKPFLRTYDRRFARRPDLFLANSSCVAKRIRQAYGRPSKVLYPPVDVDYFTPDDRPREDFFLIVSALAPYKQTHQAVEAFNRTGLPLKIIGAGPAMAELRRLAKGNVQLLGWQSDDAVREHYRRCRALVFPQVEDFGIVPLEAMACGTPVIAFAGGGAIETVRDAAGPEPTGVLYQPQTVDGIIQAVERFGGLEKGTVTGRGDWLASSPSFGEKRACTLFPPAQLRAWATRLSEQSFREGFISAVAPLCEKFGLTAPW